MITRMPGLPSIFTRSGLISQNERWAPQVTESGPFEPALVSLLARGAELRRSALVCLTLFHEGDRNRHDRRTAFRG